MDGRELHSSATTVRGELYRWGESADGELGTGAPPPRLEPTRACFR